MAGGAAAEPSERQTAEPPPPGGSPPPAPTADHAQKLKPATAGEGGAAPQTLPPGRGRAGKRPGTNEKPEPAKGGGPTCPGGLRAPKGHR